MPRSKKIKLSSSDGELFEVDQAVAFESDTIKLLIEDEGYADVIPIPGVSGKIVAKVIEYCKKHVAEKGKEEDPEDSLKKWDAEFVKLDHATLCDLFMAANYLDIKELFDLTCNAVADTVKDKTPAEVRKMFNIKQGSAQEAAAKFLKQNAWAFK